MKTIDCTPVGLTVPGGVERVNAALSAFQDRTAEVANHAEHLLAQYDYELGAATAEAGEDFADDVLELKDACDARRRAQEELLLAVAGAVPVFDIPRDLDVALKVDRLWTKEHPRGMKPMQVFAQQQERRRA